MITVATYRNLMSAELAKTRLDIYGIEAVVADVFSYTLGYGSIIDGVRLQVADEEAGRAREILTSEEFIDLSEDSAPVVESPHAAANGAETIQAPAAYSSSGLSGTWPVWLLFLLGVFCLVLGRPGGAWRAMYNFSGQVVLLGEILIVVALWLAYGRLSETDTDGIDAERKKDA